MDSTQEVMNRLFDTLIDAYDRGDKSVRVEDKWLGNIHLWRRVTMGKLSLIALGGGEIHTATP